MRKRYNDHVLATTLAISLAAHAGAGIAFAPHFSDEPNPSRITLSHKGLSNTGLDQETGKTDKVAEATAAPQSLAESEKHLFFEKNHAQSLPVFDEHHPTEKAVTSIDDKIDSSATWVRPSHPKKRELLFTAADAQGLKIKRKLGDNHSNRLSAVHFESRPEPITDVINQTLPVDYTLEELTAREQAFIQRLKADFAGECELRDISLSEFFITAEYFKLSKDLFAKGKKPAFTLDDALGRYQRRLNLVKDSLESLSLDPENNYRRKSALQILLMNYAKGKHYDVYNGGSILTSLFHNTVDCQAGTKEVLALIADIMPDLKLGINSGSRLNNDGTKVGHVQAYVYDNDESEFISEIASSDTGYVIETTSINSETITPYTRGQITPIELVIANYYPEIAEECDFQTLVNGPRAPEGMPTQDIASDGKEHFSANMLPNSEILLSDELLYPSSIYEKNAILSGSVELAAVSHEGPRSLKYSGRMNIFHGGTKPSFRDDFIYHFLMTAPRFRKNVLDMFVQGKDPTSEYGHSRLNKNPKIRNLSLPENFSSYQNLLATFEQGIREADEVVVFRDDAVTARQLLSHKHYLDKWGVVENGKDRKAKKKEKVPERVLQALLTSPSWASGPGICLDIIPNADYEKLAMQILDDSLDINFDYRSVDIPKTAEQVEEERRARASSSRAYAFRKALSLDGKVEAGVQQELEKRMHILENALRGKRASRDELAVFAEREKYEEPGTLAYRQALAQQAVQGLSKGMIKDAIELTGEENALTRFRHYVKRHDLQVSREASAEMFDYFNRTLVLAENNTALQTLAVDVMDNGASLSFKTGAAQYLFTQGKINRKTATNIYLQYLEEASKKSISPAEVHTLLATGLDRQAAIEFFRKRLQNISLEDTLQVSVEYDPEAQRFIDLESIHAVAGELGDEESQKGIEKLLVDHLQAFFEKAAAEDDKDNQTKLNYGSAMNALYTLASLNARVDDKEFLKRYLQFGAADSTAMLMAPLVQKLTGSSFAENFQTVMQEFSYIAKGKADELQSAEKTREEVSIDCCRKHESIVERFNCYTDDPATVEATRTYSEKADRMDRSLIDILSIATFGAYLTHANDQTESARGILEKMHRELSDYKSKLFVSKNTAVLETEEFRRSVELLAFLVKESGKKLEKPIKFDSGICVAHTEHTYKNALLGRMIAVDSREPFEETAPSLFDFSAFLTKMLDPDLELDQAIDEYAQELEVLSYLGTEFSQEKFDRIKKGIRRYVAEDETNSMQTLSRYLNLKYLPDDLPDWLFNKAKYQHSREQAYIEKILEQAEKPQWAVDKIIHERPYEDSHYGYEYVEEWGHLPFETLNMSGTLLLYRTGYLDIDEQGKFVKTDKFARKQEEVEEKNRRKTCKSYMSDAKLREYAATNHDYKEFFDKECADFISRKTK